MRKPKYRVYGRYSGPEQGKGSSEERQSDMERHRQRAEELGAELVEIPYIDRGKSGFYGDNLEAELGRIKSEIEAGIIVRGDFLWVESHSRLGRLMPTEAIIQYFEFLRRGIKLDIKDRGLRTWASVNGEHGMQVLMNDLVDIFVAYAEALQKSKHGRDTNAIKRRKLFAGQKQGVMKTGTAGLFVGRRCPAWLEPLTEPDEKGFMYQLKESVASVVRMIFDWREGGIGCYVIAQRLTAMRIEPFANHHRVNPKKKLTGWSGSMVMGVLHNRAVIGLYQNNTVELPLDENGEPIRGKRIRVKQGDPLFYYPPALKDPDQFWRVDRLIRQADTATAKRNGGRTGESLTNIAHGLVTCSCCDGPVWIQGRSPRPNARARKDERVVELKCENARRKVIFPEGHKLAGQRCQNLRGFRYPRFEALLLALFDQQMRPLLAALSPRAEQDNQPSRAKLADIEIQIERKCLAQHEREIELDELTGDERKASRVRMRELLTEIATLEGDWDRIDAAIRDANRLNSVDFEDRVRGGIAQIKNVDPTARYDARRALNRLLGERIGIVLEPERAVTVALRADRRTACITFTADRIIDAGQLDQDGRRVTDMDTIWLNLAHVAMGLENCRERTAKLTVAIDEMGADPIVREAMAMVGNAA